MRGAAARGFNAWRGAQADFANAVRYWDKPLSCEVERPSRQPRAPSAALGDGWTIEELFGYGADDVTETADFGVVTGIGLGMFGEILLVEGKGFY